MAPRSKIAGVAQMRELNDVSASSITSMHCGGKIECLLEVDSTEELLYLVSTLEEFFVLGGGTNTIFRDGRVPIPVIRLGQSFNFIKTDKDSLYVGSATPIAELLDFCTTDGLSGLEFMAGIPGKIGGALYMNAGAKDKAIMESVSTIEIIDKKGVRTIKKQDLDYCYRCGGISPKATIISAHFLLDRASPTVVKKNIATALGHRKNQPKGYSSGSIFMNPEGTSAGYLIDQVGLKGFKVGGAVVSDDHANFIINQGSATTSDIRTLISIIKKRVKDAFGIELKEEVAIVG
ncbi:MAG: UDP-N-acetylmuramate dehydrogenase [Deltaproteobacteria bacterium]|nr:UDP-N-acetylmuramate dehydrogenase [Deltaproteobacteria bacterium]